MSTATAARPNGQYKQADAVEDFAGLLEKAIDSTPLNKRIKGMERVLLSEESQKKIRASMPSNFKGEAERLIRRAIVYFQTNDKLDEATPQSLMMCVIKSAEMGLPLDGRLCHAVVYNNKYKDANGKEYWAKEASTSPDYRGLIAVAKRTGLIDDIYAEVVCEGDEFRWHRTHDKDEMFHSFDLMESPREKTIGVYSKVKPRNAEWRYELMTLKAILDIRNKSKAKDFGPWKVLDSSDWRQMAKKTVLRRVLNLFCEDPGLAAALDADDREYTLEDAGLVPEQPKRQKISDLTNAIDTGVEQPRHRRQEEDSQSEERVSSIKECRNFLEEQKIECGLHNMDGTIVFAALPDNTRLLICETEPESYDKEKTSVVMAHDKDALQQVTNIVDGARKRAARK